MTLCNQTRCELFRRLLPAFVRESIAQEEENWKSKIFENLPVVMQRGDFEEIDFWLNVLESYITFGTFCFVPKEIETLARYLYDFLTTTRDMNLCQKACTLLIAIVNPHHIPIDLKLDWKPLYRLLYDSLLSHSKIKVRKYPNKFPETILALVQICRNYFTEDAIDEMIHEWWDLLDPSQAVFILGHSLFCIFIPVHLGQHGKWLPQFLELWTLFRMEQFDFQFLSLFARLSRYGYTDIPWDSIVPYMFNIVSCYLGIPTTLLQQAINPVNNYHPELYPVFFKDYDSLASALRLVALVAVNLLTGPTKQMVRLYIERLFHLIYPFCTATLHSEDETQCEAPIEFLNKLILEYVLRVQRERKYGPSKLEPLTDEDHEWMVSQILPLALMEQFHEEPQFSAFDDMVQLCPSLVIGPALQAVQNSFQYLHLKAGAYQTLVSIAPTVIYLKEGIDDFMAIVEAHAPEDLDFMDAQKASFVFQLLTIMSCAMPFGEEHEPFVLRIVESIIRFAEHAVGEDYARPLAEMLTSLGCIVRAVPVKLGNKIAHMVKQRIDDLPETSLGPIIQGLEHYSIPVFGPKALKATDLRQMMILKAIIKRNAAFSLQQIEEIKEVVRNGLANESKKINRRAVLIIKWVLCAIIAVYQIMPKQQGVVPLAEIEQEWHVPTEEEMAAGLEFAEYFVGIMTEKFNSPMRKDHILGAQIGRSLLKGIVAVVSMNDLEPESEGEYLQQPELVQFSDKRYAALYERIMHQLLEVTERPNIHEKVIKIIIRSFAVALIPRDPVARNVEQVMNEYHVASQTSRLSVMLPSINSMTYVIAYCKSKHLYATRCSSIQVFVTKIAREIFPRLFQFTQHPDIRVRQVAVVLCQVITAQHKGKFIDLFEDVVRKMQDPDLDPEVLSSYCGSICILHNLPVGVRSMNLLVDAALAICRILPADMTDDSARSLRQMIVIILDQMDPLDPRLPPDEFEKARHRLADGAIAKFAEFPANRETQNFAAALVCSVIVGAKMMIKCHVYAFMVSILTTDDSLVRDCIMQMWPTMIEYLIPRVPRPPGVKVSDVTPENYDSAEFLDRPFRTQAKKQPKFLTYDEMIDPKAVSVYFQDNVEERVDIHKMMFEKLAEDDDIINQFVRNLVNAQVHKEETFSKIRVLFWSTLCRFFGVRFMAVLMNIVDGLTGGSATFAHHVIAAEIFAGCLHSLKSRKYSEIEDVAKVTLPFVSRLIETLDPEFHSLWYFSFYASFTDFDPRRLFWLFDHIITCVPKNDSLRAARAVSLIADVLLDVAQSIPGLPAKIEELAAQPLFSKQALEFEQVRECSVRALSAILGLTFDVKKRGRSEESKRILDRFVTGSSDIFISRWVLGQFSTQSIASLCAGGYVIEHIGEWADLILDKDENEEQLARAALMGVASSNFVGSICDLPLTNAAVVDLINTMLDKLSPEKHVWQVQTVLLLITESFLASVFFYVDESILESMVSDRIIPGLLHQHPDVQDSASQLLSFVVKSSVQLKEKLPSIVEVFKRMLYDKKNLSRRIAGAKGLSSIISGTVLFDEVPQYIIDSFTALADALEIDSSVEQVVTQFFSDFWTMYDNNLTNNVAEVLAPFRASLRASYFC